MENNSTEWWRDEYARLKAKAGEGKGKPKCRECNIALERKEKVVCVFCVREGVCPQ
jgi:hypothetical protein